METKEFIGPQNHNETIYLYNNSAWFVCEVIHLSCIMITLYLLYALLHHRSLKPIRLHGKAVRHRKGGTLLENLCIVGILIALLRFSNNQLLLLTGTTSSTRCSVLLNVSIALYFLAIHPVYFFLWVRQRIFYSNRALKHLYSKTVRCLSWVAIICFVLTTALSMILFTVDQQNSASGRVCADLQTPNVSEDDIERLADKHVAHGVKVNILAGLLGGAIQVLFLALFLYPMMDKKLRAMRTRHMRSGKVALLTLIRRSFSLALLCILSDIAIAVLVKIVTVKFPNAIFAPLAMYDINLVINILCIIVTFRRWKKMLFPWFFDTPCANRGCSICRRSFKTFRVSEAMERSSCKISSPLTPESYDYYQEKGGSKMSRYQQTSCLHKKHFPELQSIQELREGDASLPASSKPLSEYQPETLMKCLAIEFDRNPKIDSKQHYCSDTAVNLLSKKYQKQRSTSLTLISNANVPSRKLDKLCLTRSLLSRSKLWFMDHNGC